MQKFTYVLGNVTSNSFILQSNEIIKINKTVLDYSVIFL